MTSKLFSNHRSWLE